MKSLNYLHLFIKLSFFVILSIGFFVFWNVNKVLAINTCNDGWQISISQTKQINCHGVCKKVTNNCSKAIFVPTQTSSEWSEFRINRPSCVSLVNCITCTNECSYSGQTDYRCSGNYVQKRTCGNYDADSCLEWSDWSNYENCASKPTSCGYGSCDNDERPNWYCSGGSCHYSCYYDSSCAPSCTNECSYSGQTDYRCSGNYVQKRTCGNYDADSCLEWSSWSNYENCDNYDRCSGTTYYDYYCSNGSCDYTTISCDSRCYYCGDGACNCGENHSSCPGDCPAINLPTCSFSATAGIWAKEMETSWSQKCKMNTSCTKTTTFWWEIAFPRQIKTEVNNGRVAAGIWRYVSVVPAAVDLCVISPEYSYNWTGSLPTCPFGGTKGDVWAKPERCSWSYKCKLGTNCSKQCSAGKITTNSASPGSMLCSTSNGIVYEYCDVCVIR